MSQGARLCFNSTTFSYLGSAFSDIRAAYKLRTAAWRLDEIAQNYILDYKFVFKLNSLRRRTREEYILNAAEPYAQTR
jgi:hypothetical protein